MENLLQTILIIVISRILSSSCLVFSNFQEIKATAMPLPPHPPHHSGSLAYSEEQNPITCSTDDSVRSIGRNGLINTNYRWEAFNIYLDEGYNDKERSNVNDALWKLSQHLPCIPFGVWPSNSTPSGDYVHIIKSTNNGCSSYCGRQGGRQIMNLQSPGCMHVGTITHEMLHALGVQHEHGRPDRDDYIDIQWENVEPGMEHAFQKYSPKDVSTFGVPYNLRSIMHYDKLAFSKNGIPTILAKNGNSSEVLGSLELQQTDILKLQRMYNCTINK